MIYLARTSSGSRHGRDPGQEVSRGLILAAHPPVFGSNGGPHPAASAFVRGQGEAAGTDKRSRGVPPQAQARVRTVAGNLTQRRLREKGGKNRHVTSIAFIIVLQNVSVRSSAIYAREFLIIK